ncbi:hypothetical protein LguiA_015827 [Lonicera macranthoides]
MAAHVALKQTLDLSNNFLNGTLPISLFNSSELQVLFLADNVISAELPESFSKMKSIQLLNLSDNALAEKFPEVVNSLKNLNVVSLRSNYFSDSISSGFQFVQVLDLSSNLFNGTLYLEFGGKNLRYLNLSYNKLFSNSSRPKIIDGQNSPGTESTTQNQPEHGLKSRTIAGIAVGDLAGIGFLAVVTFYL